MFSKNMTVEKFGVDLSVVQYYLKTKGLIFLEYYPLMKGLWTGRSGGASRKTVSSFRECWKAMGLGDDGQHYLENILLENLRKCAVIEGLKCFYSKSRQKNERKLS